MYATASTSCSPLLSSPLHWQSNVMPFVQCQVPLRLQEVRSLGRLATGRGRYAVRSPVTPNAACAAANRATGTRYGLQET